MAEICFVFFVAVRSNVLLCRAIARIGEVFSQENGGVQCWLRVDSLELSCT